jgi:drug/metabolite transporter (DMT)-like permease
VGKGRQINPGLISEENTFEKRDWLLLLTAAGIWGSSFLFMDVALESEHPGLITWLRPTLGLFALIWFPSSRRPVEPADRGSIVLLGITWVAFPFTMFPLAQQWIDSSITGMLNGVMPIMTLIIGTLGFGVLIKKVQILGIFVGIVGISFIGLPTVSGGGTNALGVLFVVLAVTSYGVGVNIAGPLQRKYGSLAVLSKVLIVASVLTMPFGVYGITESAWSMKAFGANLAVGLGGTGIAYAAATTLIGRVGAVRASIVTYLIPVVAALLGVFVLDEKLSFWELFGVAILIGGAWLTTRTEIKSLSKSDIEKNKHN